MGPTDENGLPAAIAQTNLSFCPEGVYSAEQRAYRVYASTPISLFGIISNLLNIAVFADYEMRQQLVNHFLLALSISDLLLLICNFFFLVLPVVVLETNSFFWNDFFPQIIRYSYPLALTVQTSGVYLTVLVSVHRFLGVCHPFKAKRWVTQAPVESAIVGSILFSFAINIPTWLELAVVPCFSSRFNRTSSQIQLASFHDNNYIIVKKCIVYTIFMFIVPFTALITVNWKIVQALRFSSQMRTQHTYSTSTKTASNDNIARHLHLLKRTRYSEVFKTISKVSYSSILKPSTDFFKPRFTNSPRDRSITLMLLAIVAMFLVCNGLAFLNSIVESYMIISAQEVLEEMVEQATLSIINQTADESLHTNWRQQVEKWFEGSVELSNALVTLNSSTSTLVYLVFSSKYRLIFKSLFGLYKREKLNCVALTTALAARRVMELSLIPEEMESRSRRNQRHNTIASTSTTKTNSTTFGATTSTATSTPSKKIPLFGRREPSLESPLVARANREQQRRQRQFLVQFRKQPMSASQRQPTHSSHNNHQQQQQPRNSVIRASQSSVQLFYGSTGNYCSSAASACSPLAVQRRTMFRGLQKGSKELFRSTGTLNRSLTNSESNLRLMDEQESTTIISPERSPSAIFSSHQSNNSNHIGGDNSGSHCDQQELIVELTEM